VDQLGPNALGDVLEPGRVTDCYLGLLLPPGPAGEPEAGTILIVAPAALLHPRVPQPAGSLLYELLTGHPEREPGELVFAADLTLELRAWPPRYLDYGWRRPRPGRPRGRRLLAGQRGQRAAGRRPRLRGGPLAHPIGDDLRPRPAARPPDRAAGSRPPALAASHQRPPTRRPVPVATAPAGSYQKATRVRGCPEPGRYAGRSQRKCPAESTARPLLLPAGPPG
jgi:hypothetical protein